MSGQVVLGAGPVGRAIAEELAQSGIDVILASRSGRGPGVTGATRVAIDASDAQAVGELCRGASVIYNALNPQYHRWGTDWPPMAAALLSAAELSGAVLVTVSNLYAYGPVSGPITEELPLDARGTKGRIRAQMFADALRAHTEGRARTVEVRASDYIGPGAESHMGDRVIPRILAGKAVKVIGATDQPHSWTYVTDVATLAIASGADASSWGRAWHVPSNPPRTQEQAVADLAAIADLPAPKVSAYPGWMMAAIGLFSPTVREVRETTYQFAAPFVMDSTAAQQHFGITATPWSEVLTATMNSYREPQPV